MQVDLKKERGFEALAQDWGTELSLLNVRGKTDRLRKRESGAIREKLSIRERWAVKRRGKSSFKKSLRMRAGRNKRCKKRIHG